LDLPCVTSVSHLTIENGIATADREIEGAVEVVQCPVPAVITTDKGINEPRYPALKGIMAAKKKPLEVKPVSLSGGAIEVLEMQPPPARKEGKIVGEGAAAVPELVKLLREEAKVLWPPFSRFANSAMGRCGRSRRKWSRARAGLRMPSAPKSKRWCWVQGRRRAPISSAASVPTASSR